MNFFIATLFQDTYYKFARFFKHKQSLKTHKVGFISELFCTFVFY